MIDIVLVESSIDLVLLSNENHLQTIYGEENIPNIPYNLKGKNQDWFGLAIDPIVMGTSKRNEQHILNYGDLKIESVGVVNYDSKKKETTMNLTSKYTFPVDEGLMEDVAERIAAVEDLKPLDFNVTTVEQAALEWAGREEADKMKAAFTINGEKNIPKEMEETMTITGIKLSSFNVRGMKEKGLISSEPTAYIVNMYDKPVYKKVPFKVFYQKAYSDFQMDKFGLQINVPTLDYYLDYSTDKKGGTMRILSGDLEFVEKLNNIKEEKKKIKNFKYQHETAGIYLSKFLRYFEL